MKFIAILAFTFASLSAWATPDLEQKISISAKKISAAEAMKQISTQAGVNFMVSPNVKAARAISMEVKEASLKDVLDFFATELSAKWEVSGESVKFSSLN